MRNVLLEASKLVKEAYGACIGELIFQKGTLLLPEAQLQAAAGQELV
jgi:hypothetical protein